MKQVLYTDEAVLVFDQSGESLELGPKSPQKHARSIGKRPDVGGNMAIITTENGNEISIACGIAIDKNSARTIELTQESIQITIGEPVEIKGIEDNSPVSSVKLRYGRRFAQQPGDARVEGPSPFAELEGTLEALLQVRYDYGNDFGK